MTSGKPLNTLLKFSLPLLAGSVIQNLYNIFDTAIVGHAGGTMILPCRRSPSVKSVAGNEQGRMRTMRG